MRKIFYRFGLIAIIFSFLISPTLGIAQTAPPAVTNLKAYDIGGTQVYLSWNLPSDTTNIDSIKFTISPAGSYGKSALTKTSTTLWIYRLAQDTDYIVSIQTCHLTDCSSSLPVTFHTFTMDPEPKVVPNLGDTVGSLNHNNLNICGNYSYLNRYSSSTNAYQLVISDISNPMRPKEISSLPMSGLNDRMVFSSDCQYLYSSYGFILAVNISDVLNPRIVFKSSGSDYGPIAIFGNYLYSADNGMTVFSLSNPSLPSIVGHADFSKVNDDDFVSGIVANDSTVIITDTNPGGAVGRFADIFSTTDKAHPSLVKEVIINKNEFEQYQYIDMVIVDHVVFMTNYQPQAGGQPFYLHIATLDFSDLANPIVADRQVSYESYGGAGLAVKNNRLYVFTQTSGIQVYGILNNQLNLITVLNPGAGQGHIVSMAFVSHYLYTAGQNYAGAHYFNIFDMTPDKVSIDKSSSPHGVVGSGNEISYDTIINNPTASAVSGVTITDPIPDGTTYVEGSATVNGTAPGSGVFNHTSGTPTWNFPTLAASGQPNASYILSFKVKVN